MKDSVKDHINVEFGCPIFIEISEQRKKLTSRIVGIEHKDYLLIRTPTGVGSLLGTLNQGKIFVVKYVHRGTAYGFKTHVKGTITSPANLLFIDYPKLVAEQSLRVESRYKCKLKCGIKSGLFEAVGVLVDLSMSGCCFTTSNKGSSGEPAPVEVGMELEIKLKKPESKEILSFLATVSNVIENTGTLRLGITFNEVGAELRHELKTIMLPLFTI